MLLCRRTFVPLVLSTLRPSPPLSVPRFSHSSSRIIFISANITYERQEFFFYKCLVVASNRTIVKVSTILNSRIEKPLGTRPFPHSPIDACFLFTRKFRPPPLPAELHEGCPPLAPFSSEKAKGYVQKFHHIPQEKWAPPEVRRICTTIVGAISQATTLAR